MGETDDRVRGEAPRQGQGAPTRILWLLSLYLTFPAECWEPERPGYHPVVRYRGKLNPPEAPKPSAGSAKLSGSWYPKTTTSWPRVTKSAPHPVAVGVAIASCEMGRKGASDYGNVGLRFFSCLPISLIPSSSSNSWSSASSSLHKPSVLRFISLSLDCRAAIHLTPVPCKSGRVCRAALKLAGSRPNLDPTNTTPKSLAIPS